MSHPGDPPASDRPSVPARSWRGTARSPRDRAGQGWQQRGTIPPLTRLRLQDQGRPLRVAVLLLLVLVFSAMWVYGLLFKAVQTPLIVVAATDYEWPLPPNAWVREDADRFGDLHRQTLSVVEASADWNVGEHALRDFQAKLSQTIRQSSGASSVLIYVSMHGVVDGNGDPCLVPPGGSPLDAASWVKVRTLLDAIEDLSPKTGDRNKILILDCNRIQADWRLGVLYNSFADSLRELVLEAKIRNLVVLNSASPGQVGWSSPELRGSAFGYFLRRALAGEADADRNRRISVGELHDYLRVEVDRWAVRNRAARQEPMLIADKGDLRRAVAWVPAGGASLPTLPGKPGVSREELRELWKHHDQLLSLDAIRFAPLEFQTFQNRLLWLERLNLAGSAYRKRANELHEELQTTVLKQRAAIAMDPGTASRRRIWDSDAESTASSLTPHSLPLAMYFGVIDESTAASEREQWRHIGRTGAARPAADGRAVPLMTEFVFSQYTKRQLASAEGDPSANQLPAEAFSAVFDSLERGEQVAVPDDERVAWWIRGSVAEGDRARRAAEDALLAGDREQAMEASRRADQAYGRADEFTELIADAFELRDRAFAEVPYLAEWLVADPFSGQGEIPAAETASLRLATLINNLQVLGEQLSEPDFSFVYVTPETVPFAETLRSVEQDFDWLREHFDAHVTKLTASQQTTPQTLRMIQAVLATPLISTSRRLTLRDKLSTLDTKLCKSEEGKSTAADSLRAEQTSFDLLDWLQKHWKQHPAGQLLRPTWLAELPSTLRPAEPRAEKTPAARSTTDEREKAARTLAKDGEAVRHYLQLQELPNISRDVDQSVGSDATEADAVWRAALVVRSRRDRLARAAAAWRQPPLNRDPVADRHSFDLQSLLLWHTERTLQDFRGPADGTGEPFSRVAARDYLQGVSLGDIEPAVAQWRDELQARFEDTNFRLDIDIENVLLVDPADPVQTRLSLSPHDSRSIVNPGQGRLALFVRSAGKRLAVQFEASSGGGSPDAVEEVPSRGEVAFPLVETRSLQLQAEQLAVHGPRLDVVASFRGHEVVVPWLVQTIGGVTVDYRTPSDMRTTLLVKGTRRKRKSFVFVLDCSDSMKQRTGVEATDGMRIQRLELAKSALQGMLDQLTGETDTRVGVRFFGHRVGWSTTDPVRVLRRKDYIRAIPLQLAPSEDVELILPLGRFDSLLAGQVEDLFASVEPWGQTPLYRALVGAIGDFERDDPDTKKHIIVITDGVNYQFTPSASGQFAAPSPTTVEDVATAWAKQKPAIHLVGFGIPEQEVAAAEREYRDLIDRTGGTYQTSVADAQVLLRKLDHLLTRATYEVLDTSGDSIGVPIERDGGLGREAGPTQLGESLAIQLAPQTAGNYIVACQQERESILLRGGEAAELELSADGRSLASVPYLAGAPRFGQLIAAASGTPVGDQFGVHRPIIENSGVRFEFSLQHPRRRFTPRPAEIWIEVSPLDADGKSVTSSYTFYDAVFAADVPVPLIRWLAKGWPDQGRRARVDCWYKPTLTPADVVVNALDVSAAPADRVVHAEFPGVEFQIESISSAIARQIRVVEWHGEDSAGVGTLKVDLVWPTGSLLPPMRVIRTFDPDNRVAAHVFTLPDDTVSDDTASDWEIRLTTAESLREGAIQLAKPIEMTLAENTDQLPPLSRPDGG